MQTNSFVTFNFSALIVIKNRRWCSIQGETARKKVQNIYLKNRTNARCCRSVAEGGCGRGGGGPLNY